MSQTPFEKQKIEEFDSKFHPTEAREYAYVQMLRHTKPQEYDDLFKDFLQTALREQREMIYKEVQEFAFELVQGCEPDCTPERHAHHQGTWDSYLKLERWAQDKIQSLTPQELKVEKKI